MQRRIESDGRFAGRAGRIALGVLLALGVLGTGVAAADEFADRVRIAQEAEKVEAYKPYLDTLFGNVQGNMDIIMRDCFTRAKKPLADPFVLVADMDARGRAQGIEVRPRTDVAACFADTLAASTFEVPPAYEGRAGFPIVIELNITHND